MTAQKNDIIIVGSGMGSLSAAVLLAHEGLKVRIIEQNWLPGGCTSSYPRKHFVFEAGATTLVGLDEGMPLWHLMQVTGIKFNARKLLIPMQVHFPDGEIATRFESLESWIEEAERVFGARGQKAFWEECFSISKVVWATSIRQRRFPPKNIGDIFFTLRNAKLTDFRFATLAYRNVESLMRKHGVWENLKFRQFVNEQLLITAQNHASEVNLLFGATALCYTNFGNYYVDGGMINLINPLLDFIRARGGEIHLRETVEHISKTDAEYYIKTSKGTYSSRYVLSGIPLNDTLPLLNGSGPKKLHRKQMQPHELKGAFTMGIAFRTNQEFECIHHQFLLEEPLPGTGSDSFFLSLTHPNDKTRCGEGEAVASISTHIHDPEKTRISEEDQARLEEKIIQVLEEKGILDRENILYKHSSTPGSWYKWTRRFKGFVGGYPQYFSVKPWQMVESRLDGKGAYICGDSTYPGQGIPGAALSGIIAATKLKSDFL